jgi:GNAT superfamily N-acetyltransferase
MIITPVEGYEIDDDRARVDLVALWDLLQREAYWGHFRTRAVLDRQVERSWRVLGAYHMGAMVGFARALADGEALGYLADVIIEPEHRGRGLGRALVREMVEGAGAAGWRWMLHTKDAHGLYADFGFRAPDATYLERPRAVDG